MAALATKPLVERLSIQEQIRLRAYERYLQRGSEPGSELADWLGAEAEIRKAQEQATGVTSHVSSLDSDPPGHKTQHFEFLPRRSI